MFCFILSISMCPIYAIKAIDRLLKDLCKNDKLFGGKTILMCGDFRQTLPVISHATRVSLIENCITSWPEFSKFHKVTLTQHMRAHQNEIEFVDFLCNLGNGEILTHPQIGSDIIELPAISVAEPSTIIEDIYGNVSETIPHLRLLNSVILAPKNDDCAFINNEILNRMPGEKKTYFSSDKIVSDDIHEHTNYPIEFLNSLSVSGIPPYNLALKENCIVLLIQNLNTGKSLVNGTRMRVRRMHRSTLDCEVLTGNAKNTRILIPRIRLTYSGTLLPFSFERTQFPVIPAFAMKN